MKIPNFLFLIGSLLIVSLSLSGCSNNSPYFQNDGPPRFFADHNFDHAPNAVPKVEAPHRGANRPYTVRGVRYYPVLGDKPMTQVGTASWYGKQFHGRKTSTGETYNMYAMTAAHPTMQLPSYAKVTNLSNGKSVIVRVNDRGPFLRSRIMDLSYAAASKLGYVKNGTAKVKVERILFSDIRNGSFKQHNVLKTPTVSQQDKINDVMALEALLAKEERLSTNQTAQVQTMQPTAQADSTSAVSHSWYLQFGAFRTYSNALGKQQKLQAQGITHCFIYQENNLFRILLGEYPDKNSAEAARSAITLDNSELPALFFK